MLQPDKPVHTPWGETEYEEICAEGIRFYITPSHGGFKLDRKRNARIHPALREKGGWYEEDCAWAKVAFTFPELFSGKNRESAISALKQWYPDQYETVTGILLAPGESGAKDRRLFHERHANDWLVISALDSEHHPGMVECIATPGGQRGEWGKPDPARCRYLIAEDEYQERGALPFVIDPARHLSYDGPSSFVTWRQ